MYEGINRPRVSTAFHPHYRRERSGKPDWPGPNPVTSSSLPCPVRKTQLQNVRSFVAKCLDGIERSGLAGGIESKKDTNRRTKGKGKQHWTRSDHDRPTGEM